METRSYQDSDYVEIADLFQDSVYAIDTSVYSKEELEAWAPTPPGYEFWQARLTRRQFLEEVQLIWIQDNL